MAPQCRLVKQHRGGGGSAQQEAPGFPAGRGGHSKRSPRDSSCPEAALDQSLILLGSRLRGLVIPHELALLPQLWGGVSGSVVSRLKPHPGPGGPVEKPETETSLPRNKRSWKSGARWTPTIKVLSTDQGPGLTVLPSPIPDATIEQDRGQPRPCCSHDELCQCTNSQTDILASDLLQVTSLLLHVELNPTFPPEMTANQQKSTL
ncbi:hypothetical protein AAFF_G00111400 [Aldrovandia affinis]|uniref:Uncharacterized protein n=1 Tax=Aldrovandia affinis TaxID=143900 RepID=A0AAD7VXS6_9TELE|nr:hypothetical protein AAFF_G00111400 [Aldrovandia affinis]